MTVGSLFSGIGGFDYGLERAGMRVAWQCEADAYCRRVLGRHWPDVLCYPDVSELRGDDVEPVDVLCGGFPCQDISLAGKGAGIDGARSGLWGEYARLVGEIRPRYVIVENVSALLVRGLGRVLGDLAALGYDAEWDCLPASAFGAPHQRDRLWLVAYPNADSRRLEVGPELDGEPQADSAYGDSRRRHADRLRDEVADAERGGRQGWPQDAGRGSADGEAVERREGAGQSPGRGAPGRASQVADTEGEPVGAGLREGEPTGIGRGRPGDGGGTGELQDADERAVQPWRIGGRAAQAGGAEWWAVEPGVGRVAHGVPDRLARLAALGNALVPQIAQWLGERILEWEATSARAVEAKPSGRNKTRR